MWVQPVSERNVRKMNLRIFKSDMEMLGALTEFYLGVTTYLDSHINYPKWTPGVYPGEESIRAAINAGTQYVCMEGDEIVGAFTARPASFIVGSLLSLPLLRPLFSTAIGISSPLTGLDCLQFHRQ